MPDFDMPKVGLWEERGGWVVRRLAHDLRLSLEQAAGLVGNLGHESVGFTRLQEQRPVVKGSRGGYGWAQWTGPRRRAFEDWCRARSLATNSDEANYGFLVKELTGPEKGFAARLSECETLEEACRLTHKEYERSLDAQQGTFTSGPDRLKWAKRALVGARNAVEQSAKPAIDLDLVADLVRALQRVVGTKPDGRFGPITMAAVEDAQRRVK